MMPPAIVSTLNTRMAGLAVLLILGIGTFLLGYQHGLSVAAGEQAEIERDTAIDYANQTIHLEHDNADLVSQQETARKNAHETQKIITREVIRYANRPDTCQLPAAFRMLHDAAATGTATAAEANPVDAGSTDPVADAAALDTITSNYALCHDTAEKLKAWQQRYQRFELVEP